ncbi:unnamed protein product [Amoebophrya sp. A25]|nr:unnamed protein product [Amoebophrya sp. A25]|eukprot:GSA25T00026678001.1
MRRFALTSYFLSLLFWLIVFNYSHVYGRDSFSSTTKNKFMAAPQDQHLKMLEAPPPHEAVKEYENGREQSYLEVREPRSVVAAGDHHLVQHVVQNQHPPNRNQHPSGNHQSHAEPHEPLVSLTFPADSPFHVGQMIRVYNVTNVAQGTLCKIMGYHVKDERYVVRDGTAHLWGVREPEMSGHIDFEPTREWKVVPPEMIIPAGLDVKLDMGTGLKMARLLPETVAAGLQQEM